MTTPENVEPITQTEIDSFSSKLEEWGGGLPPNERALLQLLLSRAAGTEAADLDVQGYTLPSLRTASFNVFSPLLSTGRLGLTKGWVEAGDPWAQWSARQY